MKKFDIIGRRKIWYALSLLIIIPGIICMAAVAIAVRGHRLLTLMPWCLNSPAWPSVHMLMPYLAMV